jgi:hypothetical protein
MERNGVTLLEHPEAVVAMGTILLNQMLPELGLLLKRDVKVVTDGAVQQYQGKRNPFDSAEFNGYFADIKISEVTKPEFLDGLGEFVQEQTDVVMVFKQRITDADPVDLGYSDEIFVPMSDMDSIRRLPIA